MILDEIRNISSSRKDLRNFGLVVGGVLAAIGVALLIKGRPSYDEFIVIGTLLAVSGLLVPVVLKPLYLPWMALSVVLGWIMTRVILILLYSVVMVPIALVSRAFGKKFINRGKPDPSVASYWQRRQRQSDPKRCTRLY